LCAPGEAPRRQSWILCQAAVKLAGQPEAIVHVLLDWLNACGGDAASRLSAIAPDLFRALDHPLHGAAQQTPYERLLALMHHPLASVRALACEWLLLHAEPASSLPPPLLAALLVDPDAGVRGMAVRLFGALTDAMLSTQRDLVAIFDNVWPQPERGRAMQLFVSAWLERTSSGDIDKLRRLEPYFLSVLSQANRAASPGSECRPSSARRPCCPRRSARSWLGCLHARS
jgi:hypothetical protein